MILSFFVVSRALQERLGLCCDGREAGNTLVISAARACKSGFQRAYGRYYNSYFEGPVLYHAVWTQVLFCRLWYCTVWKFSYSIKCVRCKLNFSVTYYSCRATKMGIQLSMNAGTAASDVTPRSGMTSGHVVNLHTGNTCIGVSVGLVMVQSTLYVCQNFVILHHFFLLCHFTIICICRYL